MKLNYQTCQGKRCPTWEQIALVTDRAEVLRQQEVAAKQASADEERASLGYAAASVRQSSTQDEPAVRALQRETSEQKQARRNDERKSRIDGLAKLGPEGREKKLRACYAGPSWSTNCTDLALDTYAATDGAERSKLAKLSTELLGRQIASWKDPPTNALICCDGSESAACACGSELGQCCLDNGGACGCR